MKIIIKYTGILLSLWIGWSSCVEDRGNYIYQDLSPVVIGKDFLQESYVISQMDYLHITAQASQVGNDEGLEYTWTLLQNSWDADPVTGKAVYEVIGRQRELNVRMVYPPGKYRLSLRVSDERNEISAFTEVPVTIRSFAPQGWMILHGDQDSCDVSVLTDSRINPRWSDDFLLHHVFSETNGHRIPGEAAQIRYLEHLHNVYVFTHREGGYRTGGNDLKILNSYRDMFMMPLAPDQVQFESYDVYSYNEMVINRGILYYVPQAEPANYMRFGAPCYGQDYYASPYIATQFYEFGGYGGIIYDMRHRRFLNNSYNRSLVEFKQPGGAAAFDMRNVGMDMLYAEHGFEKKWYCIMKDPGTDHRYLYVCDFMSSDDGNRGTARYDMNKCENIGQACYYALGNRGNVLYYATAHEVFQYQYSGDNSSVKRYSVEPGYEISCLQIFKSAENPYDSRILFIGIYHPLTGIGKLLALEVQETDGSIVSGTLRVYEGFGKIASMVYKTK